MKKAFLLLAALVLAPPAALAQSGGGQKAWDDALAAARKEGKVVVSGPPSQQLRQSLPAAFRARYGITLEYLGGRSSETAARMRAEKAAGISTVDVMVAGIQTMATILYREKMIDPLKPVLVLPEVVDGSKWKKGKLWFSDPEDLYILRLSNFASVVFHINTTKVRLGELRSVQDLLDPKWKEKISLQDPTVPGSGSNQAAHLYIEYGEEFVRRLYIDQKPSISRDTRQLTDWLARGTYPISAGAEYAEVDKLRKDGLPIAPVESLADLPGEISAGFGQVALLSQAPHPNAARIFVNWLASKEGGEVLARAMGVPSTRNDVDEGFLPAEVIPRPGVAYFDTYEWDFTVTKKEQVRLRMKELLRGQ